MAVARGTSSLAFQLTVASSLADRREIDLQTAFDFLAPLCHAWVVVIFSLPTDEQILQLGFARLRAGNSGTNFLCYPSPFFPTPINVVVFAFRQRSLRRGRRRAGQRRACNG